MVTIRADDYYALLLHLYMYTCVTQRVQIAHEKFHGTVKEREYPVFIGDCAA